MSKVFVFIESQNEKIKKGSLELLSWAKDNGLEVSAGAIGAQAKTLAEQAGHYGAKTVFTSEPEQQGYNPETYTTALTDMINQSGAKIILANATATAKDVFPRVAMKLNSAVASDCIGIQLEGDKVTATKPLYAGKCTAEVEFVHDSLCFVLMRSNQLPVGQADSSLTAEVKALPAPKESGATHLEKVVKGESNKPDLTEANVIVSGGRGLGEAKNFEILEELASVLGATVGASRAVVDAGWVPHSMQVGQTGKTVSPSLYVACGISGAIQHLAGMSASKVIVAINKDPDAPIFQKASYGLVGDVFEIAPHLKEELKKALQH